LKIKQNPEFKEIRETEKVKSLSFFFLYTVTFACNQTKEREPTRLVKTGKHKSAKERIKKKTLIIVQDKLRIEEITYLVN
jgi:hypothetical protein